MWYPYLALFAALLPLLMMGIGYMMMGRRDRIVERRGREINQPGSET